MPRVFSARAREALAGHFFGGYVSKVTPMPPRSIEAEIEAFVERWYSREVDIGRTRFMGVEIDLLPDAVEKHLYRKVLLAVFTFLRESRPTLSIAGLDFELRLREPGADSRSA